MAGIGIVASKSVFLLVDLEVFDFVGRFIGVVVGDRSVGCQRALGECLTSYIGGDAAEQGHDESNDCNQDHYRNTATQDSVLFGFVETFEFVYSVIDNLACFCSGGFSAGRRLGRAALGHGGVC